MSKFLILLWPITDYCDNDVKKICIKKQKSKVTLVTVSAI